METAKLAIHKSRPIAGDSGVSDKAGAFGRALRDDFLFDKKYRNLNHGIYHPTQISSSVG
jgi:hypothetical protein